MSSTTISFTSNGPMALATLKSADGHVGFVWASIPGGRCYYQTDLSSQDATSVVNSPTINNMTAFRRFVNDRFGD